MRNRAWFYLAQIWYARGYLDKADAALRKVNGRMSPDLEAQKELLFANVLMHEGRFDEAIRLLSGWRGGAGLVGLCALQPRRRAGAQQSPRRCRSVPHRRRQHARASAELRALRDRANLALGFAYLQANQPDKARPALERVRLNGPYSNKALLGTGWADAALGDYQGALTPWMELRRRDLLDAAVQESYLAVPYAFSKLNANAQSAEYYESAVTSFAAENVRLDAAIARIDKGEHAARGAGEGPGAGGEPPRTDGWFWQLKSLPDAPESRYLYAVLAGHDFQEGLKNYRDLVYMGGTLERWGDSMGAFEDMIDTRERAYAERLPRADALLASGAVGTAAAAQRGARERAARHRGAARRGGARHSQPSARNGRARSAWRPRSPAPPIARERGSACAARAGEGRAVLPPRRCLRRAAVAGAARPQGSDSRCTRRRAAGSAWSAPGANMPANTGEFAARVARSRQRIDALQVRLAAAEDKQSAYLARIAVQRARAAEGAPRRLPGAGALCARHDVRPRGQCGRRARQAAAPVQKGAEPVARSRRPGEPAPPQPQGLAAAARRRSRRDERPLASPAALRRRRPH